MTNLPIIVVDGELIFPGGFSREMTPLERLNHQKGNLMLPIEQGPGEDAHNRMMQALAPLVKQSYEKALEVYRALCNVAWVPLEWSLEGEPENYDTAFDAALTVSWRTAGALVALMREEGEDYLDFYCCGGEGRVSSEITTAMSAAGMRPVVGNAR